MPHTMGAIIWLCHWCILMMVTTAIAQPVVDTENASHRNALKVSFQLEESTESQIPLNEPCTAMIRDIMSNVGRADLQCLTPTGMAYSIPNVNKEWIEEKQQNHELISGYTQIDLPPNTMIDASTHALILDSTPILKEPSTGTDLIRRRRLATADKASGKKTVLVVRVEASDSTTTLSESQLRSDVFGDNGDPNNLRSQYLACSYGKFELNKASDRNGASTNIRSGTVTVRIPSVSTSVGDQVMLNEINRELGDQFSTAAFNLADFVMYCMPPDVMHPLDVAYAFMDGYKSIYNDAACNQVSTQLHEVGHNLNLAHSGFGGDEYADKSGMMGYSYEQDDLPYMCFNGAKSWQLGWYQDKAIRLAPTANSQIETTAKLAGVADYGTTAHDVVIKIEQEFSEWAYFVAYNAGKGINEGTQYGKDRVLVTMKDTSDEANVSTLVAKLRLGQSLKIRNFNGRADQELLVGWAAFAGDVATMVIRLQGPNVPVPTKPPTTPPTISQSSSPSSLPSAGPSSIPTISPSSSPSLLPSAGPSEQPTISQLPTLSTAPSNAPTGSFSPTTTEAPSQNPSTSFVPSVGPSTSPPSQEPSIAPSYGASQSPSLVPSLSQYPSSSPSTVPSSSTMPSWSPSLMPSEIPSVVPSQEPSLAPSMQPSFRSSEFESTFVLQLPHSTDVDLIATVCDGLVSYVDGVTKSTYGNETVTSISCLPVVDTLAGSQNVFDHSTDVTVVMTTYFPKAALGPNSTEYESHVVDTLGSDETSALLPGIIRAAIDEAGLAKGGSIVRMEWDDQTSDNPVLIVEFQQETSSPSSGMHISMHLGCI
mmetsp:Transcript_20276/g.49715  ORF Transcript_20276/g.49715 Transcript_20276/m.49715 type:complete len:820 (-) Transcript_20276:44-2503(-)